MNNYLILCMQLAQKIYANDQRKKNGSCAANIAWPICSLTQFQTPFSASHSRQSLYFACDAASLQRRATHDNHNNNDARVECVLDCVRVRKFVNRKCVSVCVRGQGVFVVCVCAINLKL